MSSTAQLEDLVSRKDLAKRLNVSTDFIKRSELPKVVFGHRCVRYRVQDVLEFIERRKVIPELG